VQIIYDARDTQLCPDCVDLFMKWCDKNSTHESFKRQTRNIITPFGPTKSSIASR